MKKIILITFLLFIVIVGIIFCRNFNNYDGNYEIYVEKIDDLSPDRRLIVKRNGKETKKYKYIEYLNGETKAILCYSENPSTNVFNLNVEKLTIVLKNGEKKVAKLIKEEK